MSRHGSFPLRSSDHASSKAYRNGEIKSKLRLPLKRGKGRRREERERKEGKREGGKKKRNRKRKRGEIRKENKNVHAWTQQRSH